jgi:M6 family metalloprotease-like protein
MREWFTNQHPFAAPAGGSPRPCASRSTPLAKQEMSRLLAVVFTAFLLVQSAAAQEIGGDVELLGRMYGTRPPASYFATKAGRPDAFQFQNGWLRRGLGARARITGEAGGNGGVIGGLASVSFGRRQGPVQGTFYIPLVLGLFADSPDSAQFSAAFVQREFFDGPSSYYKTIPQFYSEMSGGMVTLKGETRGWVRSMWTQSQVTKGESALPGQIGIFIADIVKRIDNGTVDWGRYDNDGPDGIPNTIDDDGYVDILAVMHPVSGAECDGSADRIWSHKWNLSAAMGQVYATNSPSARGGYVKINDYTVQPVISCPIVGTPNRINEIGVFAHELGHAFGLPDLYCTSSGCGHTGVGSWGLMGAGAWGCRPSPSVPQRPCMMEAWSRVMLGWAQVDTVPAGTDLGQITLPPVETSRKVLRVAAGDASRDYFLIENRQPIGFDEAISSPGLLVWRIDEGQLDERWASNTVNNDRTRMGVWMQQADNKNDLARAGGNRGDAGDPYPGASGNTQFHAGSLPAANTHLGVASGLTLTGIQTSGQDVRFRLLTRFQNVTIRATGVEASTGLLTVNGAPVSGSQTVVRAAPYQVLSVEASPGVPISDGVRRGFESWMDNPAAERVRAFVTGMDDAELVAKFGRREVQMRMNLQGGQFGVTPGQVLANPASTDFWFPEGAMVTLTASPTTGFGFTSWSGVLAGQGNPAHYQVNAPVEAGAVFTLNYKVQGAKHVLEAASTQEILLLAENSSSPVSWTLNEGRLPEGLTFGSDGALKGAAFELGLFPLNVTARDAKGLTATGTISLEVTRPTVGVQTLVSPFLKGAIAPTDLQRQFLDRQGNRNGAYDVGDLRAFLLANPNLPMTAQQKAMVKALFPALTLTPVPGGQP